MNIIKITANENGSHNNQTGNFSIVPNGFAIIPDDMIIPTTFPFVDIDVANGVVIAMTANQTAYDATLAEQGEPNETDKITEIQLALAELAALITGGADNG